MGWAQMPSGWLNAYAAMYGRLRDEEQLRGISTFMAGSGNMQEDARRDLINGLTRSAPRVRATVADLVDAGIRVVES